MNKNEANDWTGNDEQDNVLNVGRLVVLLSTKIGSDRNMRQKILDVTAISNSIGHPDILLQLLPIRTGQRYKMRYLRIKRQTIYPICVIVCFV